MTFYWLQNSSGSTLMVRFPERNVVHSLLAFALVGSQDLGCPGGGSSSYLCTDFCICCLKTCPRTLGSKPDPSFFLWWSPSPWPSSMSSCMHLLFVRNVCPQWCPFSRAFSFLVWMSRRRSWSWSAALSSPSSWLLPLGAYLPEEGELSGRVWPAATYLTLVFWVLSLFVTGCPTTVVQAQD